MGQVKWTITNHTKDRSSSKEGDVVYMVGLGVLYYELLPENWTVNSNKYCPQFDQLKAALDEKHPELVNTKCIIFHQDNTRLPVSLMTRQKLLLLGWEVLIHLPYSPDIATLDFHLQNSLNGKKNSIPWKTVKDTWNSSLHKTISFGMVELRSCLKNGKR